jgi:hypothetical protein
MVLDSMWWDDTLATAWSYGAFFLSLVAMIVLPVLFALFGGMLVQRLVRYTIRLIQRKFIERHC